MINLSNFVLTQLTSLALAFFTAYLTVKFSLKKFFTEKWWERKADAYSNIVECLYLKIGSDQVNYLIQQE